MGAKQLKKIWHLKKTTVAKTNWTKQCKVKNAPYIKMTVAKKIGAKQLKIKMAPYKNDCGEKKLATVQDEKMQFIKWLLPKNGAKQLQKMAPYKNDSGPKNLNQTA